MSYGAFMLSVNPTGWHIKIWMKSIPEKTDQIKQAKEKDKKEK